MTHSKTMKLVSSILSFIMALSLLAPFSTVNATALQSFKKSQQSESTLELKAAIAEQQRLTKAGPTLHESLQDVSGNKEISVIVHLSEKPVALEQGITEVKGKKFSNSRSKEVRANVKAQQNKVKKQLSTNKIQITQGYTFDTVLNGFAATLKANDLPELLKIDGVTLVEPDATVYAQEETNDDEEDITNSSEATIENSNQFLGIEKLWNEGFEGQGIKVAVLDTGIDADHPEFEGIYKGGKNFIPNSTTYSKTRTEDDASETLPSERPEKAAEFNADGSSFYTSHGTHVAGTIAAIGANEYGIKGLAPKVDLYAYRVLGAYGSGSTSGIIKAIDTAVIEKMDVINLSLGGGANTEIDAGSFAINNAMMAGTISVIATGNSGNKRGTMGTPSTARLGIAVGNTTLPETQYNGQLNITAGDFNLTQQLPLMGTTFGQTLSTQLQGEFDLVSIPGNAELKDFENIDVDGKVALISRGSIAFVEKIANAKANGAVATIIHNSAGGTNTPNISGTFLGDSFEFIPTFDMSYTDGVKIREALSGTAGKISFGNFKSTQTTGDNVNDSSSRGPSIPNFDIKPDVSAPGTNIMSTIPMYKVDYPNAVYDQAYDRKTGTSMATPHVAAIAALVKQANPEWNAFDVKVALSNTADLLDTEKYDVFAQGAGRVNPYAAAHPEILAYAIDTAVQNSTEASVENLKGTVTFGPQPLKDNDISVTKQVKVKDITGSGGEYNVSVDVTKTYADAKITVDEPTFNLNGEQLLNITLTASQSNAPNGSEILGYIHITNNDTDISLPFAAEFASVPPTEIQNYKISETDLSFNGDGVKDSAQLAFTLTGDVAENYIELWDVMNPEGGKYEDGYIGYLHYGKSLSKGDYYLNIRGQYTSWSTDTETTIPDGMYTIDYTASSATGIAFNSVGPIFVKSTKPSIAGTVAKNIATGQVTDKYIDYNTELANYGLEYDLNDKLTASYIATINGQVQEPVAFKLKQDGSYSFPVAVTSKTTAVSVVVADAAGNTNETVIYKKPADPVVSLEIDKTTVETEVGKDTKIKVTEVTFYDGKTTKKDVTKSASYKVANDKIATVKAGTVTGKKEGKTSVKVTSGKLALTFDVTVTKAKPNKDKDKGKGKDKDKGHKH